MRIVLVLAASLILSSPAWADICIENTREIAQAAVSLIPSRGDVVQFCAPCGDAKAEPMQVGTVKVGQSDVSNPGSFEVMVNGSPIDLAYTYACKADGGSRRCEDVGLAVKCTDDKDVPAVLPDSALAN